MAIGLVVVAMGIQNKQWGEGGIPVDIDARLWPFSAKMKPPKCCLGGGERKTKGRTKSVSRTEEEEGIYCSSKGTVWMTIFFKPGISPHSTGHRPHLEPLPKNKDRK